jgi:acetyl-CoA C-acetyltransferase
MGDRQTLAVHTSKTSMRRVYRCGASRYPRSSPPPNLEGPTGAADRRARRADPPRERREPVPLDPRTPVLVGLGQTERHPGPDDDLAALGGPLSLMEEAARRAGEDSGGDQLLRRASSVQVVSALSWRYENAAWLLARRLGAPARETVVSTTGGNSPQMLVSRAAKQIAEGVLDVVLVAGAEAMRTRLLARSDPRVQLPWAEEEQGEAAPSPTVVGDDRPGSHEAEAARSLVLPVQVYPLFENAIRFAWHRSIEDHERCLGELWSRFSAVASTNPHAWSPVHRSAAEITTVGPDNRMIAFPYPKLMNANLQTDQGAALVLCSAEAARAAGVPRDRWVFPLAGAEANDCWFVSERADLHSSPAIAAAGARALELAEVALDDVSHVDLYSCFPAAVEMGAEALGLELDDPHRPLTVTGGLGFAGGPGNNYSTHAIATMAGHLRDDEDAVGLVTALGWFATKHAIGVYSGRPPRNGFRTESVQSSVDSLPSRRAVKDYDGPISVETWTVTYERDGSPTLGIVACLLPDGSRSWGLVRDASDLDAMTSEEQIGRKGQLSSGGDLVLA